MRARSTRRSRWLDFIGQSTREDIAAERERTLEICWVSSSIQLNIDECMLVNKLLRI